ncbi:MAG: gamma carbonic anhydrase family protein [Silvanigrellaceae bacterium]|nr:gamma carbonic anhydrase family protein [Silvanigrellaceae bacterium]
MDYQLGLLKHKSPLASVRSYQGIWPQIPESVFLADGARVIGDVVFEEDCSVWFNAIVRGDVNSIRIGKGTNIQDNAVIHCTFKKFATTIGAHVSIAHSAIIHGCEIEEGCLIGMSAIIMDGAHVGKNSIVGAGSLITQGSTIPEGSLVLGAPGKVVRKVTEKELEAIHATTVRYLNYKKGFDFIT